MPRRIRYKTLPLPETHLREWREHKFPGEPLEKIARMFRMSGAQLSRIERGLSPPTLAFLAAAARRYGTTPESLIWLRPGENSFVKLFQQASHAERVQLAQMAVEFLRK